MNAYTFNTDLDVNEIGRSGSGRVSCKVTGYWSSDSITLYIRREFDNRWGVQLSHSSGGRDTKEVASDLDAEINFGRALIAMAEFGKTVETHFEEFETLYQAQREADRKEWEAQKAAKQAEIDADTSLGVMAAEELMNIALQGKVINVFKRGETKPRPFTASYRAKTSYYYCGDRIAKKDALRLLAESSNRTSVAI
jgi:hypothetical protein